MTLKITRIVFWIDAFLMTVMMTITAANISNTFNDSVNKCKNVHFIKTYHKV